MPRTHFLPALWLALAAAPLAPGATAYVPSTLVPPAPLREFRGVWVATVGNKDWPGSPGLTTAQQKAELLAILDRAAALKLNAIVLQVRTACDALYDSKLEPWSEYLTGRMGQPPEPFYDPLALAVAEAHARGLELHAWINPYRARFNGAKSPVAPGHISRTQPELVRRYGEFLWLDPGSARVRDHSLAVALDIVKRYDVDGLHMDDYFYPYKTREAGKVVDFPDEASFRAYVSSGGRLARDDWRRENVNRFIQQLYAEIKAAKPWVKFGVSPFGIWRPGNPAGIKGMDSYTEIYADSRKWLASGWVDYFSPQLYWGIDSAQSFPALLKWWAEQNSFRRHLWPGIAANSIGTNRDATEILNQIKLTREQAGVTGNLQWSIRAFMKNSDGVADKVRQGLYTQAALVPASPWLEKQPPGKPALTVEKSATAGGLKYSWSSTNTDGIRLWLVQTKVDGRWINEALPGSQHSLTLTKSRPEAIAVTAFDRAGNAGSAAVLEQRILLPGETAKFSPVFN